MRTWVCLDVSYLGHRALHTTGDLAHEGEETGVVFGLLRDLLAFSERFESRDLVFCFDHGKGLREQAHPFYKETRRKKVRTDEEEAKRDSMRAQLEKLRTDYLYRLGFTNIFYQKGYEADDVMASVCRHTPDEDRVILVSSDQDLYQLLSRRVAVFHPVARRYAASQDLYTARTFKGIYGIHPRMWVKVKAIAGCGTDDIPGVDGVAEVTAAKYCRGDKLRPEIQKRIERWVQSAQYQTNCELIDLPYGGTRPFTPEPQELGDLSAAWDGLTRSLGMESLVGACDDGGRGWREGI